MQAPTLSIVIPAYNEAKRLPQSLTLLQAYSARQPYAIEVIVVDDGSVDDTSGVVATWMRTWPALRLIQGPHTGKGGAVRAGCLAATGAYIMMADADFSMPVEELDRFAPERLGAYDIVIGSREVPGAIRYNEPIYRHLMGRVFNRLVQLLLLPGIQDTQCGFKRLSREAAIELCRLQTITGWGFDVELLFLARLRGLRLCEVPISWYYAPGSRVNPVRDTVTMARDLLTIRFNSMRGRYTGEAVAVEAKQRVSAVAPPTPRS